MRHSQDFYRRPKYCDVTANDLSIQVRREYVNERRRELQWLRGFSFTRGMQTTGVFVYG